jgi:hypothetical protein
MLISILLIAIAFTWLIIETHFLTIQLEAFTPCQILFNRDSDSVLSPVVLDTDTEPITAIVEHKKPLLLEATCSLTKQYEAIKPYKRMSLTNPYKISSQTMQYGIYTIRINPWLPNLYDMLDEINKTIDSKFKPASYKIGQLTFPTLTKQIKTGTKEIECGSYKGKPRYKTIDVFETVYRKDLLVSGEWLELHSKDVIPEATMELLIDDKTLHVNGNYKANLIGNFMGDFTHKERAGKKGLVPVMNGEHLERWGDNFFACKDGEHLN